MRVRPATLGCGRVVKLPVEASLVPAGRAGMFVCMPSSFLESLGALKDVLIVSEDSVAMALKENVSGVVSKTFLGLRNFR